MLKMNKKEKLQEAQNKSEKAIIVFKDTMNELITANDLLNEVINEEKKEIEERQQKITLAKLSIVANKTIIDNLTKFTSIV